MNELNWWRNKKVLITGHTGFKGSWLCKILCDAGADVTGYSLEPETEPALFNLLNLEKTVHSEIGDIRDLSNMEQVFGKTRPEIVLHLAAQPIVRTSYAEPVYTYETNVMGTVNICECVRNFESVKSFLNVTTDKVYENKEWAWGYRENEALDGYDPYSNSKSCSELVTHSYINSFFKEQHKAVSTARAGNVIGGGDFAPDRIIPDCVRAAFAGKPIVIRNPHSIRPYQHVLEPLAAYLMIARAQYENGEMSGFYNVGPNESDCITTGELVSAFRDAWGEEMRVDIRSDGGPHEANYLRLDCSLLKQKFHWKPRWNVYEAVKRTVEWTKGYRKDAKSVSVIMEQQIADFFEGEDHV